MKKLTTLLFVIALGCVSSFSQKPISIERVINDLNWGDCSESDVVFAFKDNVVKREIEETWDGGAVSSFILKDVKIGEYTSDANIIVRQQYPPAKGYTYELINE